MPSRSARLALSVLALTAFAFVAAGCGTSGGDDDAAATTTEASSDDSGSTTTDDAPTDDPSDEPSAEEQSYIEQVNAICGAGNRELEEMGSAIDAGSSEVELEAFVDSFVANIRGQLDEIEAIEVPDSMADDVDTFLETARAGLDTIDEQGASSLMSEDDPFGETNEMALDLGFTECGSE